MVLKDWKLISDMPENYLWQKKNGKELYTYKLHASVVWDGNPWVATNMPDEKELKTFKTKAQALKFAKEYMRTH